jgi:uncharacterized protein YrrD
MQSLDKKKKMIYLSNFEKNVRTKCLLKDILMKKKLQNQKSIDFQTFGLETLYFKANKGRFNFLNSLNF